MGAASCAALPVHGPASAGADQSAPVETGPAGRFPFRIVDRDGAVGRLHVMVGPIAPLPSLGKKHLQL